MVTSGGGRKPRGLFNAPPEGLDVSNGLILDALSRRSRPWLPKIILATDADQHGEFRRVVGCCRPVHGKEDEAEQVGGDLVACTQKSIG